MTSLLHSSALVIGFLCLAVVGSGCALRATTDFGPQSDSSTRSVSFGPKGLPGGVSGVSGPQGDSIRLRGNEGSEPDNGPPLPGEGGQ